MTLDFLYYLAMLGTIAFALSGAMAAARKEMDIFGFFIVGLAPAIGGGTLRDLLLGAEQIFWISDPNYIYMVMGVAAIAFFQVHRLEGKRLAWLMWADALGLALFTMMGTKAALAQGLPLVIVVSMGVITGTFGGIIRDVICNEIPLLLQKEIYALPAIAGSLAYALLSLYSPMSESLCLAIGLGSVLAIRIPAMVLGWSLPGYKRESTD